MPVDNLRRAGMIGEDDGARRRSARFLPPFIHMSDRAATLRRYAGLPHPHRPYYRFLERKNLRDRRVDR